MKTNDTESFNIEEEIIEVVDSFISLGCRIILNDIP